MTLRQSTAGYFADPVLIDALKEAKMDVDGALAILNAKKLNSWSSVVSKASNKPFTRVETSAPTKEVAQKEASTPAPVKAAPAKDKPAPAAAPAAPVDPEKHIEALAKQIDETVRETETRAQQLKNIQVEIQNISGTAFLLYY